MDSEINTINKINLKSVYLIVIAVLVIISLGTYAWLSYRTNDTAMVLTIGEIEGMSITLSPYQINGTFNPTASYTNGLVTNVEAKNNKLVSESFKLYYKINTIASELVNSNFKYTITKSTNNGSSYSVIKNGNFSSASSNAELPIYIEEVPASTTYQYKVYLWIDNSGGNQSGMQGKIFNGELRATILSVPAEYERVEYIEGTGTQYINSGINPSGLALGIDMTFKFNNTTNDRWIFGEDNYSSGDIGGYEIGIYSSKFLFLMTKYNKTQLLRINVSPADTNIHNLKLNITDYGSSFDGTFIHNEVSGGSDSGNVIDTASYNLYILGRGGNLSNSMWANSRIYGLKIYNGTELIRDYIPCYEKNNMVSSTQYNAGLYDIINGVFYDNDGSGIINYGI